MHHFCQVFAIVVHRSTAIHVVTCKVLDLQHLLVTGLIMLIYNDIVGWYETANAVLQSCNHNAGSTHSEVGALAKTSTAVRIRVFAQTPKTAHEVLLDTVSPSLTINRIVSS